MNLWTKRHVLNTGVIMRVKMGESQTMSDLPLMASNCSSSFVGSHRSSASKSAIHSPLASSIPRLRAADSPRLDWRTTRTGGPKDSAIEAESSVEPSSTTIISSAGASAPNRLDRQAQVLRPIVTGRDHTNGWSAHVETDRTDSPELRSVTYAQLAPVSPLTSAEPVCFKCREDDTR